MLYVGIFRRKTTVKMEDAKKDSLSQKMSKYDFIRFCVCDIAGISKSKVIPSRNAEDYIEKGPVAWTGNFLKFFGEHSSFPVIGFRFL